MLSLIKKPNQYSHRWQTTDWRIINYSKNQLKIHRNLINHYFFQGKPKKIQSFKNQDSYTLFSKSWSVFLHVTDYRSKNNQLHKKTKTYINLISPNIFPRKNPRCSTFRKSRRSHSLNPNPIQYSDLWKQTERGTLINKTKTHLNSGN